MWTDDDKVVEDLQAFLKDRKFEIEKDIENFGLLKGWLWLIEDE